MSRLPYFQRPRDMIQKARSKREEKAADIFLDKIAAQIGDFDAVILQFEPGIFGNVTAKSLSRVKRLLHHSKNFALAFHYIPRESRRTSAQLIRPLRPIPIIKNLISEVLLAHRERMWSRFYGSLAAHAKHHKVGAIAHTKRDARHLRFQLPDIEVLDNPLTYMDDAFIANIETLAKTSRLSKLLRGCALQ